MPQKLADLVERWEERNQGCVENTDDLIELVSVLEPDNYLDLDDFFDSNPGAIEAVVEWISEQKVDEWRENLKKVLYKQVERFIITPYSIINKEDMPIVDLAGYQRTISGYSGATQQDAFRDALAQITDRGVEIAKIKLEWEKNSGDAKEILWSTPEMREKNQGYFISIGYDVIKED